MQKISALRQLVKIGFRLRFSLLLGMAIAVVLALPESKTLPAVAQSIRPDEVWQRIYQQLPDLPRENQYVNKESRKVDPSNTLIGRLIRYHLYVKGRSPLYRLDWKLTLADYLGVNESIIEETYPSSGTLAKNPQEADIAAVRQLNRAQRTALVELLVNAFMPSAKSPAIAPALR
jgi:hypothetical protein